jgi:hypothetical protein
MPDIATVAPDPAALELVAGLGAAALKNKDKLILAAIE